MKYFQSHSPSSDGDGLAIQENFYRHEIFFSLLEHFFSSLRFQSTIELDAAIRYTFTVSDAPLFSSIVNTGVQGERSADAKKRHNRFPYTNRLLTTELNLVGMAKWGACTDVRAGWLSRLLDLDKTAAYKTAISATSEL